MLKRKRNYKNVSVYTRCNEYENILHIDDKVLFSQQLTLASTQVVADLKKQVIKDLIEAFTIADIPLEKVNSLLPFFKKHVKNEGSIPQTPTLRQIYLPNVFERHY
ncbi:hypothetical protein RhiirC2_771892 [Rhizophagus irregularis]|uniref:Uncharacterized protein n=1 Tax=Rhizophagus irregularis TaxID=588596 RepID=A0A2N1NST5_9GLOM|nr:hypothetical protein RhiirC2_771892 [Rhizophagus irregularis]